MKKLFLLIGLIIFKSATATPHKCEVNGKIIYQENNCESGKIEEKTEAVKDYTERNKSLEKKVIEKLKAMGIKDKFDIDSSAKGQEIKMVEIKIKNVLIVFDKYGELIKYEKK